MNRTSDTPAAIRARAENDPCSPSRRSFAWLTPATRDFLGKDVLPDGDVPKSRMTRMCDVAEDILGEPGFGQKFWDCLGKGWFSLSSPIWANFGTDRGLPISCFGSRVGDSMEEILEAVAEVGMMSKVGGGTAGYLGEIRPRGSEITGNGMADGPVSFLRIFEALVGTVSQGRTRRGNFSPYLPIRHPDAEEFLTVRTDAGEVQDVFPGICVDDDWLHEMIAGDSEKRRLWAKVLECRCNFGTPYLFFTDNVNRGAPDVYRDKGMRIDHSQLCSEILLPTSRRESFVCDLSSLNMLWYDEWAGTDAPEILVRFLDAVMTEFIRKASKYRFLERAVRFAERHRALGVGWVGWHSYLQSKGVPFESMEAKRLNTNAARTIRDTTLEASRRLAREFGEPELLVGYGRRNTTLQAIAPTKSSSFILGQVSESIEPYRSNYDIRDLAKGKFTVRNPFLTRLLEEKGRNDEAVWKSILEKGGSVRHLDFLDDREKAVFRTMQEISPKELIDQAAARQKFIDQGQSLNLMIDPFAPAADVNELTLHAWRSGVKTLYYQHGVNAAQAFCRDLLSCASCEA